MKIERNKKHLQEREKVRAMTITIKRADDSKRVDFTVNGKAYHTNDLGLGLWDGDDYLKQISGTAQFSLTQKSISGMRKVIEKTFRIWEEDEDI